MPTTPMQLSIQHLMKEGWLVAITEHWNAFGRVRQDLFGFADLIGVHPDQKGATLFQVTTGDNHAARVKKIKSIPAAEKWLASGNAITVISWREVRVPKERLKFIARFEAIERAGD